jgi:hypothetical protein
VSVTADAMTAWQGDYRSFVETVKRLVHTDWSEVRAGDAPPALYAHREGCLHTVRIPGQWFGSLAAKEALVRKVFVPLASAGCQKFATVNAAWGMEPGSPLAREINRLVEADAPIPAFDEMGLDGLCEDVLLSVFDAERHEAWLAEVTRDRTGRPTLGKWRLEGPDAMSGHWIDPIREAMR